MKLLILFFLPSNKSGKSVTIPIDGTLIILAPNILPKATDKCIAGLELIKNGENGYIVPVEDENILYEQMNKLILDEALRKKMGENSLKKIHEYTFETMAKVHMDFLNDYSESGNNK